jgi:hypothetical protein
MGNFLGNLNNTQRYLLVAIMAVVLYLAATTVSYSLFSAVSNKLPGGGANNASVPSTTVASNPDEDPSKPKTESCPLNGSMHIKEAKQQWDKRRPLAVMIENHTEARPQSGLTYADIVYEAVAEGGITRFMAIYLCSYPEVQVGPVRSARTYFIDWLSEYDALYAHVGGANTPGPANALGQIVDYDVKDLNQFSIGFPTYWRDYQRLGRPVATEHTMYSSTNKLWEVGAKRGWSNVDEKKVPWDKNFVSWKFIDGKPGAGTVAKITVPFWEGYGDYTVTWTYDKNCNCYLRSQNNTPLTDMDNKKQLGPANVVVQFENESHANDGYENNAHLLYATNGQKGAGTGKALVFQNGQVIEGKWVKPTRLSRSKYVDNNGQEIPFVKGQIWIETVPTGTKVTY